MSGLFSGGNRQQGWRGQPSDDAGDLSALTEPELNQRLPQATRKLAGTWSAARNAMGLGAAPVAEGKHESTVEFSQTKGLGS